MQCIFYSYTIQIIFFLHNNYTMQMIYLTVVIEYGDDNVEVQLDKKKMMSMKKWKRSLQGVEMTITTQYTG